MGVEFKTAQFVFAHGRKPSGFGQWAFDFGKGPEMAPPMQNYGEAKKWAARVARERGVRAVTVCS